MKMNWIIIADGEQLSESRLKALIKDRLVLVCDGAIHRCLELGIEPDVLLGDFDSLPSSLQEATRRGNPQPELDRHANARDDGKSLAPTIIHALDQNKTDSEKALDYVLEQGATDIILCQAMGDRTDHSLNNLSLLSRYYDPDKKLTLARENEVVLFAKDTTVHLNQKKDYGIGILGFPQGIITTNGLAYNCKALELAINQNNSISNKITSETTLIDISGSALITLQCVNN